ncbi:MAG: DUF58 domain-containing protein [Synergistaceae bacterium]|jgi:uncharacterized protein (DUF58 family)|nr:DUF58 domain-containing protein [Synergistaceae bacterium]
MTVPTKRAAILFSFSAPLALLIVSLWRDLWYVSLCYPSALLALMAADVVSALPLRAVSVVLHAPALLCVGRPDEARLELRASGFGRPAEVGCLLEQTGCANRPTLVTGTVHRAGTVLSLPIVPLRRGKIAIDAVWLRWRGPLGLVETRVRQPVGQVIDVLPDMKRIHDEVIQFFSRDAEYGVKSQAMRGEGTEFEDLCEYDPGMDHRRIDWKRSARHRKILCKNFRQERNHHIVIGFDTGRLMTEPLGGVTKLDRAIRAGLVLGWVALRNGDFLGGCGFDVRFRSFIKPVRGVHQFARFQGFAADLDYRTEETNFTLGLAELNSRLAHRALVVLFTEFADMIQAELLVESLGWMTRRHAVIFVTMRDPFLEGLRDGKPGSFLRAAKAVLADDFLNERSVVLERVARLGVHCLDVPAEGMSAALLNRYLMIKARGLL